MAGRKRTDNKGRILKDGESQRADGIYRYRYTDASGTRRDIYSGRLVPTDKLLPGAKNELSLREKEKLITRDLQDGIKAQVENKATVNDFFDLYMASKTKLKESTRTNYIYMYDKYVRDVLGSKKIKTIKYSTIYSFYCNLIDNLGLKPNSMETIHTILHPLFRLAVRDDCIRTNPTSEVMAEIKKAYDWKKPKRHALTIQQQTAFMNYIAASSTFRRWYLIMAVFLGTGCRAGEIIGLRWEDADFQKDIFRINHNMLYRKYKGESVARFHITTPKTDAGNRLVPMMKMVKELLLEELEFQKEYGFCDEVVDGYSGFIFQNRFGGLLTPHDINRAIERICASYNKEEKIKAKEEQREPILLPHFTVHNLRHTFCTRLCENESNLKVIQEIMGHADIETTMDIYAEATIEKKQETFTKLEGKVLIA